MSQARRLLLAWAAYAHMHSVCTPRRLALGQAVLQGQMGTVARLTSQGVDLDAEDAAGVPPLQRAVECRAVKV